MKRSQWLTKFISGAYKAVVSYIFFLILAALLFMAAFSTCFVDAAENIYYLPDNWWTNLAVPAVALALALIAAKTLKKAVHKIENDGQFFKKVRRTILISTWIVLSLWTICTQMHPRADQKLMFDVAKALSEQDFSAYSDVNYLYTFNHQIGLAMVQYILNMFLGEYNYVAYQLINAILVVLIYKELSEIGGLFGLSRVAQLCVILLGLLFTPIALYLSFIYGTIPGLFFALIAIRMEIVYFRGGIWKHAISSAICIAFAVMLKSNYMIFMLGMLIYAVTEILCWANIKRLLIIMFVGLFCVAQAKIPIGILAEMRGAEIPTGVSKWAWVTMGLQENANPGWYSGYTLSTLIGSDYDTKRQEIWVKEDLKGRLEELWEDKDAARDFFVRKTASQWNEPSFESMFILLGNELGSGAEWPKYFINEHGNRSLTSYLNYLHFIILSGSMLYLLLCSKSEHFHDSLIFPMIIIGGFLFHMVWEAKSQYTLPYFVLLLPYTVMGYSAAAEGLSKLISGERKTGSALCVSKKEIAVKLVLLAAGLLILWYVFHGTLGSLTCDTEAYMNYLAQHS